MGFTLDQIKLGLSEQQAKDFCYNLGDDAFEAGKESERESFPSNMHEGFIGKDGFYFGDWFNDQIK